MNKTFKHLQLLTIGVFLLMSTAVFAAKNECYSDAELKDFKTLYIKLQNELNYEGKDAYLNKNFQVQLKPHAKDAPYPGKEFEAALFGEYQNSLKKIGKLYQDAKFEGDDNFKSNEMLVNFMKAIDDKSSASEDFINKTKIKDVINALEDASKKKYAKAADKKFVITEGDKYLLEKLLTHAQDRVCSVSKYEQTNKGTTLFKADYLQKIKNAPLNVLVNTIKNAPIQKDSKIDLKPASDLTADLVDPDIAVKSAITDNLNQLSAWVKKVKSKGAACLAAIKTKSFANNIQGNIQGCNFGHFMDTLGQDNVNNLESVLHFINANERLLNQGAALAETNLDEMKLEGFISKTFDNLGTEVKCTLVDSANAGDKKVFVRNLPYNEKENKFDTSGIICKTNSKLLGADSCKKQFDLVSDSLGRGLEIKPKHNVDPNMVFSINEAKTCAAIAVKDLKSNSSTNSGNSATLVASEEMCMAQSKDGVAFTWDPKVSKCGEVAISAVSSIEQCMALKKSGKVFNWDLEKKSCNEFSSLMSGAALKQSQQMCEVQKRDGYSFKWDAANKECDQSTTLSSSEEKSLLACEAKDGFKWNITNKSCDGLAVLSSSEQKTALFCEAKSKDGSSFKWNTSKKTCDELLSLSANDHKSALSCEAKLKNGSSFKWNNLNKACDELPILSASEQKSKDFCDAKSTNGISSKWDFTNKKCLEGAAALATLSVNEKQAKQFCESKQSNGAAFTWNIANQVCELSPLPGSNQSSKDLANSGSSPSEKQIKLACEAKSSPGNTFKWNSIEQSCQRSPASSSSNAADKEGSKSHTSSISGLNKSDLETSNASGSSNAVNSSKANSSSSSTTGTNNSTNTSGSNSSANNSGSNNSASTSGTNNSANTSGSSSSTNNSGSNSSANTSGTNNSRANGSSSTSGSGSTNSSGTSANSGQIVLRSTGSTQSQSSNGSTSAETFGQGTQSGLTTSTSSTSGSSSSNSSAVKPNTNSGNSHSTIGSGSSSPSLNSNPINQGQTQAPNNGSSSTSGSGSSEIKTPNLSEGEKTPSAEQVKCEARKKDSMAFVWIFEEKKCLEVPVTEAKIKCEEQKQDGLLYVWHEDTLKCEQKVAEEEVILAGMTKEICEAQKKDGTVFTWDTDKKLCNESTAESSEEKSEADLRAKEIACEKKNTDWVEKFNGGRPDFKYRWEDSQCKDVKPEKSSSKKGEEKEVMEAIEAPSAPKRAPARFTPINIPSRQIYLMPGMP